MDESLEKTAVIGATEIFEHIEENKKAPVKAEIIETTSGETSGEIEAINIENPEATETPKNQATVKANEAVDVIGANEIADFCQTDEPVEKTGTIETTES